LTIPLNQKKKQAILKLASRKFLPLKYKTTKTETMTKNSSEKFTIKLRKIKKKGFNWGRMMNCQSLSIKWKKK
jgi:hypothetical protein